jgi:hypothetical protein
MLGSPSKSAATPLKVPSKQDSTPGATTAGTTDASPTTPAQVQRASTGSAQETVAETDDDGMLVDETVSEVLVLQMPIDPGNSVRTTIKVVGLKSTSVLQSIP